MNNMIDLYYRKNTIVICSSEGKREPRFLPLNFDTISCQEDQIFDISIPADRIIPNSDNTISFRAEYGLEQTAGQYVYFQLLSTGRY